MSRSKRVASAVGLHQHLINYVVINIVTPTEEHIPDYEVLLILLDIGRSIRKRKELFQSPFNFHVRPFF